MPLNGNKSIPKSRFELICQRFDITLEELARVAEIDVTFFDLYATGEMELDELTLHKILDFSKADWFWLEHGGDVHPFMDWNRLVHDDGNHSVNLD